MTSDLLYPILAGAAIAGVAFAIHRLRKIHRPKVVSAPAPAQSASRTSDGAPSSAPGTGRATAGRPGVWQGSSRHKPLGSSQVSTGHGSADDLLAIVGFNETSCIILPPTAMSLPGLRGRVDELTSPKRFRGGTTNLSAGVTQALAFLEKSRNRVRRLVVISDGEPNLETEKLPALAAAARASRVSICTIFCGTGNAPVLQSMADRTVGGWHTSVAQMEELAAAMTQAGAIGTKQRFGKKGIVVVAVDLSSSMAASMGGGVTRIEGCRRALHALLDHHAATYGVAVARRAA